MSKPMPFGCLKRKLLANAYYLPTDKFNEMIIELEHNNLHTLTIEDEETGEYTVQLNDMQYCIHMVNTYGEWLH